MNFRCVKGFLGLGALFGSLFLGSGMVSASEVDTVTLEVPVSCTLTKTVNTVHEIAMRVGQYEDDIGETAFNVICNDPEGFSIYAVGYSGDEYGNTTMVPTNNGITNAIATGTATSGDVSNWAMKLASVSGDYAPTLETGFNDYHVVPDTYTKVVEYPSNTDASSGSSFKSTYATYISTSQAADTYVGKVKFTVVHPANAEAPGKTISQLIYMQDFLNLSADDLTTVKLSMAYNTTYNLIDSRDNKTYQVARLKDNNIWMAQDLDLGRTALSQDLTSSNTNLNTNISIAANTFNGWIKTAGTGSFTSAELISLSASNTSNQLNTDPTSGTPYGTLYNYCAASAGTVCADKYLNDENATSDICPAGWRLPTGGSSGEFRALYLLSDYNTNAKMRAPIDSGGAAFALAGRFWSSAPEYQGSGQGYWSSTHSNGGSNMYYLGLTGSFVYPTYTFTRPYGVAIRCVVKKPSHPFTISYGTGITSISIDSRIVQDGETISLEEGSYRIIAIPSPGYGFSSWSTTSGLINDVSAKITTYSFSSGDTLVASASYVTTEMQNISQDDCTTNASQVRDIRDNHVYTVQRLADGKCWMMENLDLGRTELAVDLTSSNTNVSTTISAATLNGWKKVSSSKSYTSADLIPVSGGDVAVGFPYGVLYNFCAASAGTICSTENNNTYNATKDICPSGWRLPTGGSSGEFQALYDLTNYNTNTKMRAPIADNGAAFILAGSFDSSAPAPLWQNETGYYWSSTRYNDSSMHLLRLNTSNVYPASFSGRAEGGAVRCVANS